MHGIRDITLLESAVARPQNLFHYYKYKPALTIYDLGAAYAYGIIKNHPFIDGNKPTGMISASIFLRINNQWLEVAETEFVSYGFALADGTLSGKEFSFWLQQHCKTI